MKCQYIDECPSASEWCSDRSEENDCLTFLLTANEDLKNENKQLKEKFEKAMGLLKEAIEELDHDDCHICVHHQDGYCHNDSTLCFDKWKW